MKINNMDAYLTLESLRLFEEVANACKSLPLTTVEFWSVVQRGLEIRMESK